MESHGPQQAVGGCSRWVTEYWYHMGMEIEKGHEKATLRCFELSDFVALGLPRVR